MARDATPPQSNAKILARFVLWSIANVAIKSHHSNDFKMFLTIDCSLKANLAVFKCFGLAAIDDTIATR